MNLSILLPDFIPMHPGATKLLMAAGSSVEPFWAMYAVHLNNPAIYEMLERFRYFLLLKDKII